MLRAYGAGLVRNGDGQGQFSFGLSNEMTGVWGAPVVHE
jgi:hypothetical protein